VTELWPIGRFARLSGLSPKALRLYDEQGLLRPAAVDPDTGYRLYGPEQLERAAAIRRLRRIELPLAEIAVLLAEDDPTRRHELLAAHRRRLAVRGAEIQIALQRLEPLLSGKEPVMGDDQHARLLTPESERQLAADLFNATWTLLETASRTQAQDDEMLHMAHASRHHWSRVGTTANLARGEWQCSRVYAVLGRPEPALHHARRCLEHCLAHPEEMAEFDQPFAHEALARAHAVAGDETHARHHLSRARELAAGIEDPEDRDLLLGDLASVELPAATV
jgi:DNA-binding transcriptional MerR regulator